MLTWIVRGRCLATMTAGVGDQLSREIFDSKEAIYLAIPASHHWVCDTAAWRQILPGGLEYGV